MNLEAPFESVVIDLESEDQKKLKNLIELQLALGDNEKSIGVKHERQTICGIPWRKLKLLVMNGDTKNYTQITIPLQDHEQLLLMRYIDAERREP